MEQQKDTQPSLSTCTVLFQIFGLQYFSLSSKNFLLPTSKSLLHKFAFIFIILLVTIEVFGIGFVIDFERQQFEKEKNNNTKVNNGFMIQYFSYFFMDFVVLAAAMHSWFTTVKAMKIYNNMDKIYKIFEGELGHTIKYDDFANKFKYIIISMIIIFTLVTISTLGFVFYHNQSSAFYWALLVIFPYLFVILSFMKFIFYMQIIDLNLEGIVDILRRAYNLKQINRIEAITFNESEQSTTQPENETIFDSVLILKKIYGILYETSIFVNEICGISSILQLITLIIGNTSAGYKVYLVSTLQLPVGRIGGEMNLNLFFTI